MTAPTPRTAPAAEQPLLVDRILARCTEDENGCWLWQGRCTTNGYCQIETAKSRRFSGHRLTYEHFRAPIPDGLVIDHLCRVRHCVNPWHLEPVTQQINTLRGKDVGKANATKTSCKRGHPFDEANTGVSNRVNRRCKRCHADQMRTKRQARRAAA